MPEFHSRWLEFSPETDKYRTDETDKRASVSFVSPIVDHVPEKFSAPDSDALQDVRPPRTDSPSSDLTGESPCPVCGYSAWRESVDGSRWCLPCVQAGRTPVAAVKVHSTVLDVDLWVVADDLPREQWPTDAPLYTQCEVQLLRQAEARQDVLEWVQMSKELFDARVVSAGKRSPKEKNPLKEPGHVA